jgi:hypothetical protein
MCHAVGDVAAADNGRCDRPRIGSSGSVVSAPVFRVNAGSAEPRRRPGQHVDGVVLTFTDRPSELTGLVQDASGQPATDYSIIVFAADRAFWTAQSRRIKSARPDQEGKYTLRNLPAGDYLLVAVIDVEQDEWFDPSYLQRVAPAAIRVAISDGEKKVQDLRIAAGR